MVSDSVYLASGAVTVPWCGHDCIPLTSTTSGSVACTRFGGIESRNPDCKLAVAALYLLRLRALAMSEGRVPNRRAYGRIKVG